MSTELPCYKDGVTCLSCADRKNVSVCDRCLYNVIDIKKGINNQTKFVKDQETCSEKKNTIKNCMEETLTNGVRACRTCDFGYYFQDNECVKGPTEHCMLYFYSPLMKKRACVMCSDKREVNATTLKCEPIAQNLTIPNCNTHQVHRFTVNKQPVVKSRCVVCDKGYSQDLSQRCVKECAPGCGICDSKGVCVRCDMFRSFFPNKEGKCVQSQPPEGHFNPFMEKEEEKPAENKTLKDHVSAIYRYFFNLFN